MFKYDIKKKIIEIKTNNVIEPFCPFNFSENLFLIIFLSPFSYEINNV